MFRCAPNVRTAQAAVTGMNQALNVAFAAGRYRHAGGRAWFGWA